MSRPRREATPRRARLGDRARSILGTGVVLALVGVNAAGLSYYSSSLGERVRDPLHSWFKPSGYIGQSLGILAASLFLFLWLYPLRKKYNRRLARTGSVAAWLDWHVSAGLLVPWIAATHAAWRFTGLIGLGYLAMVVVYLSGLVGRYLYGRIPRTRDGLEMSREEVASERERLLFELTAATGLPPAEVRRSLGGEIGAPEEIGLLASIRMMIADDLSRRRAARALTRRLGQRRQGEPEVTRETLGRVLALARREMALAQQVRMLEATQRIFKWWHAAHKPVAVTALFAVAAHIIVAIAVGATWFH